MVRHGVEQGAALTSLAALAATAALALSVAALPGSAADGAGTATVRIFAPRGDAGASCKRVFPLQRAVPRPAVLAGALRALVRGPTAAERSRGYGGWFSHRTAGKLRTVRLTQGVAYVDFADFSRMIPNASTACGSALLLAQLDRTAKQFPSVRRTVYSFDGSRRAFYEWLQRPAPP